MNALNTLLAKLTFLVICGAGLAFYIPFSLAIISGILCALFLSLLLLLLKQKKSLVKNPIFGTLAFSTFFVLGIFTTSIHLPTNQPAHLVHAISSEASGERHLLKVTISEELKSDLFNRKSIAEVNFLNKKKVYGKLLLLSPRDSLIPNLHPGTRLLLYSEIKEIKKPMNPYQFDYHRFMALKGVQGQINLKPLQFEVLNSEENEITFLAFRVREKIGKNLQKYNFKPEELAIVQALLLGQKQQISEDIYQNYADAGAVHILAVSGLHVGIVMLIIGWILSPLKSLKKGKFLRSLLILLCLWIFAVLSGLSPSVVRAVTMFSFISIGLELGRRTSTINSVFLSLLLLVLIRPQWLFDVGFQLSYSAVFAILLIQPLLLRFWSPQKRIIHYFWVLLSTTFAAQLGVFPLSLFYFHQFPGLFFLSNLVILPFLGMILGLGILAILLAWFSLLPSFIAESYEFLLSNLNAFVSWIAGKEDFLFKDVAFGLPEVFSFYLFFFTVLLFFYNPNFKKLVSILIAVLILQVVYLKKAFEYQEETVIFQRTGHSIVGCQKGENLMVFSNKLNSNDQQMITNYKVGKGISSQKYSLLGNVYYQNGKLLLLIDSTGVYPKNIRPEFLLLSNSPKINLERTLDDLQPKIIIADGSNNKFLTAYWRRTSEKRNLPFYSTAEIGALTIR